MIREVKGLGIMVADLGYYLDCTWYQQKLKAAGNSCEESFHQVVWSRKTLPKHGSHLMLTDTGKEEIVLFSPACPHSPWLFMKSVAGAGNKSNFFWIATEMEIPATLQAPSRTAALHGTEESYQPHGWTTIQFSAFPLWDNHCCTTWWSHPVSQSNKSHRDMDDWYIRTYMHTYTLHT